MKEKNYIIQDNKSRIDCPYCGFSKTVNISKYLKPMNKSKLKIRCKCSKTHIAAFERRQRHRKNTNLQGQYFLGPKGNELVAGEILISDISISGVQFQLMEDKMDFIGVGDRVVVEFRLNDRPGAVIKRDVVIKNINDCSVNAEFVERVSFEKDLSLKIFLCC
jgi:hypothetical protein